MSDPQSRLLSGFIHNFKQIVDRVDPHDLVHEFVQRRILPLNQLEQRSCEIREQRMMRLLCRVYRQSLVDQDTMKDFVRVLHGINGADAGHRYEDIIESLTEETSGDYSFCDFLPFNEIEQCVFNCTRRVAEKSLEPDSILPELVSGGVISVETLEEVLDQSDRVNQIHCLMEAIRKNGSRALHKLVSTLLESEDRSAHGVGKIINECLEAQEESPHTPPEWLGKEFTFVDLAAVCGVHLQIAE